jgi:hypothetical protein
VKALRATLDSLAGHISTKKRIRFRTKFARMDEKVIVIIPNSYHKDVENFEDEYIDVEISEA